MFYQLPPVGNPVTLQDDAPGIPSPQDFFLPYRARFYASGTAALAAAVRAAIRLKGTSDPEVILPAYGCPDLVSATLFAGARPVLVDLAAERPWMDLDRLATRLNQRTVAIVAVDLFGIRERLAPLRELAADASALLIEDSAQAFPNGRTGASWGGELVVLSFGRGKPVSLLGGGAVLIRDTGLEELLAADPPVAANDTGRIGFRFKAALYNIMISPYLYWLPQGLPFLHLGETRYHPLAAISAMDELRQGLLGANIAKYQSRDDTIRSLVAKLASEWASNAAGGVDLPGVCNVAGEQDLLRYPLLLDQDRRDRVFARLQRSGLGPSRMYPAPLPRIPGLESLLAGAGTFPAADAFSRRILTLPLHGGVREEDIENMQACLRQSGV